MSKDDWWVRSLSDQQIREFARKIRKYFGVDAHQRVDVIACLQSGRIWTTEGEKELKYELLDGADAGTDGCTELIDDTIFVRIANTVHWNAVWGSGRDRMTHAHELAHAVLHPGVAKTRRSDASGRPDYRIPANKSAEHQAKVFAAAFLVDENLAIDLHSAEEISEVFGISLQAAEILYSRVEDRRERERNALEIRRLADECIQQLNPTKSMSQTYAPGRCAGCGCSKLIPIGCKFYCKECGVTSDKFQDGDP